MDKYLIAIANFMREQYPTETIWNMEITPPREAPETAKCGIIELYYTGSEWNHVSFYFDKLENFKDYDFVEEKYIYNDVVIWSEY